MDEWHILSKVDMLYYKEISEKLYYHPVVLSSMLKLVSGIGSKNFRYGILIIANMFKNSNGFEGINIKEDIVQYLEITIRKILNQHRSPIRRNVGLKGDLITIHNWLVEHEYVLGYKLREDVL